MLTMFKVFQDDTVAIQKRKLCQGKLDAVLFTIHQVLIVAPFKIGSLFHEGILRMNWIGVNIFIWLKIWLF